MQETDRFFPTQLAISPEGNGKKGRLKIFFGACAGVGKTFAMLAAAVDKQQDGINVMVGIVETHGRPETEQLLKTLPIIPLLELEHRGVKLKEFDLDAALKAKPGLLLVDELAHTNAPNSRHSKRWMDIVELLEAGIDVYTTLNVQHLESLNDIVTSITGIRVRETVPDSIFDNADDITLVDIPSDELLERLREGKVYITAMGKRRAADNFFRRENLISLRELALRRTAERVDAYKDVYSSYLQKKGRSATEKLAVCIGPGELSLQVIRATKRLASGLKAPWVALYVENQRHYHLSANAMQKLERNLRMAEQLGAKTEVLQGVNAAATIMDYAKKHGITKIIAGKPVKSRWKEWIFGSLVQDLIRRSGNIDIYVITKDKVDLTPRSAPARTRRTSLGGFWWGTLFTILATILGIPLRDYFNPDSVGILYLTAIVLTSAWYGWTSSIFTTILCGLAYGFIFTEPYYSFGFVHEANLVTLSVLLLMGGVIGAMVSRLFTQSYFFKRKDRNTSLLYALSQELSSTRNKDQMVLAIAKHIEQVVPGMVMVWLADEQGVLELLTYPEFKADVKERTVARWAFVHKNSAGLGTQTMPSARGYYVPLEGQQSTIGVIGLIPHNSAQLLDQQDLNIFHAFALLAATALERVAISVLAEHRKIASESEKLRNTLLGSLSHDLRNPLTSIKGAIDTLLMQDVVLGPGVRQELLAGAYEEVSRLERVVSNILRISQLESGQLTLQYNYYFVNELVGNALRQVDLLSHKNMVLTHIPEDLPAVWVDGALIQEVIVHILDNARRYTPMGSMVMVNAKPINKHGIEIAIEDNGHGIPKGLEDRIFEKFSSESGYSSNHGIGLGLPICKGILSAHGSTITAQNKEEGGARFTFMLPIREINAQQVLKSNDTYSNHTSH